MAKKNIYWNIKPILAIPADYYVIYGERSNGKTYGTLDYCLEDYFKNGSEFVYLRRWDDDIKGSRGETIFNPHIMNGVIKRLSKGKWDSVKYKGRNYYLLNSETKEESDRPFAYARAISQDEHNKGTSLPYVRNVVFDEFLTRGMYLPDEFIRFQNTLSTIIRLRSDVKIFMLGNTVNKYAPYIKEMGLYKIATQQPNTIDVYSYGETELKVAVEYSSMDQTKKKSNKYFAFNNPRLNMIKNGSWEIDIYPHYPRETNGIRPKDIIYKFFINFNGNVVEGDVIEKAEDKLLFLFFHPKTTPIKDDEERALIYQEEACVKRNYRRKITKPVTRIEKRILSFFAKDKVFYSDNETGEIVRNYINWCKS